MTRLAIHARRDVDSPWALCRGIRGRVSDEWDTVTCKACLAARYQEFPGDYHHRHRAYSKAIAGLREQHREEFEALYLAALSEANPSPYDWTAGETP